MKKMQTPPKLCRYRPLDDSLFDREMDALQNSYLYAPLFSEMNDPMEAFYQVGSPDDQIIDIAMRQSGKRIEDIYEMFSSMVDKFALVSFAETYEDLPMWAYYGSNFAGMCLEFDTSMLSIGDFQNEQLMPVTYARQALPSLTFSDIAGQCGEEAVLARITRKRSEWAHEKEWRYLTGEVGPKHYLDNALKRVFLGAKAKPEHAERVCDILDQRPTEVLQGKINGYELNFRTIKPAREYEECERVGQGKFEPENHTYVRKGLEQFLEVPYETFLDKCQQIAKQPNLEEICDFDVSVNDTSKLFLQTTFKFRGGRGVYHKYYFDKKLNLA